MMKQDNYQCLGMINKGARTIKEKKNKHGEYEPVENELLRLHLGVPFECIEKFPAILYFRN